VQPSRAQQALARRVAESRATVPHLELSTEVEVSVAMQRSLPARVIRACALALREVPRANAAYRDGQFELYSRINIGIALPSQDAIVVATLFDADTKVLDALSQEIAELSERARAGELAAPQLAGATFTLWPASDPAVSRLGPLIVAPQAAALGAGAPRPTAVVRDGAVRPGHTMTLTLACDHRILYGGEASRFVQALRLHIQAD
jgi:pyruvate dehydrogenase E2 component (dihydrolipoamide acetyltransferase)